MLCEVRNLISRFQMFSSAVSSIYHSIQKIERLEMAKYGLKGPHVQCLLTMLKHPDGITSAELVKICDKDKAAVSRTVAELEKEGMISRQTRNGNLYRAQLFLTDSGKVAASRVENRIHLAVSKAGEGLTDEQRTAYCQALELIAANLQSIIDEGLDN